MCGHLACGIAKMVDGILIVRHPGIVQDDHIGCAAAPALVVIGRRPNLRDDGGFGTQLRCSHSAPLGCFREPIFNLRPSRMAGLRGRAIVQKQCGETSSRTRASMTCEPRPQMRSRAGLSPARPFTGDLVVPLCDATNASGHYATKR